jgi:hypothetical protein
MNLLLSMDGQDRDVWAIDRNMLQWHFVGYEIEKRFILSVRGGRDGDVLDLSTLLHGVLHCGMYSAEFQTDFLTTLGLKPHELRHLEVAVGNEGDNIVSYTTGDTAEDVQGGLKELPSYTTSSSRTMTACRMSTWLDIGSWTRSAPRPTLFRPDSIDSLGSFSRTLVSPRWLRIGVVSVLAVRFRITCQTSLGPR